MLIGRSRAVRQLELFSSRSRNRLAAMSCVICLSKSAEIACFPCGHLCACASCLPPAKRLPDKFSGQCPVCREVATLGLRVFFSGAVVANEPQAPPELPVEQSPHPVVNRCGALLVSINFIEGPTTPRTHGALRFHVVYLKAICDHSRADEELWDTVLAVEDEWMSETPNPKESWCMSMGCCFARPIKLTRLQGGPCIARKKRPMLMRLLVRIFRLRTASMCLR